MLNYAAEKSGPKMCDFCNFKKKLPKANNNPIGENSPNLVTLTATLIYLPVSQSSKNLLSRLIQSRGKTDVNVVTVRPDCTKVGRLRFIFGVGCIFNRPK
jgi:hypothetical protein